MEKNSNKKDLHLVYKLDQLLKSENIEKEQLIELGKDIIQELSSTTYEPSLFDKILKNYMTLLTSFYPEHKETFKRIGYQIINTHIEKDLELTLNMILFDCHMIKDMYKLELPDHFGFYNDSNSKTFAEFRKDEIHHNTSIMINEHEIKNIWNEFSNKRNTSQKLFFAIGHELRHAYIEQSNKLEEGKEYLLLQNIKIEEKIKILLDSTFNMNFYFNFHDNLVGEYDAHLFGMKTLYDRYQFFSSITEEDKIEMNQYLATFLYYGSYQIIDDKLKFLSDMLSNLFHCECNILKENNDTIAPSNFTKQCMNSIKKSFAGQIYFARSGVPQELPPYLKEVEDNLTDFERFLLGYDNPYLDILKMIADGELVSTNLFEDIPKYYDAMQKQKVMK